MNLKPGVGVDNLIFGMRQSEIEQIMGKPDQTMVDDDDEIQIMWIYNKQKIRLTFYANEDNKLGYIRTSNVDISFNNIKLLGLDINFVINKIFEDLNGDWETDEYAFFSTYTNYEHWIVINVEYGVVESVELGLPFNDDDTYKWPGLELVNIE